MSEALWNEVRRRMDEHLYMTGVERTVERVRANGEIFTPTDLVLRMVRTLPIAQFSPGKTVLDPACGDGQFLVAAKWVKVLAYEVTEAEALQDIYGIDVMIDNVELCRLRLEGGTILCGDALAPERIVPGQTEHDRLKLLELFGSTQMQLAMS